SNGGAQELLRIDRLAIDARLIMQVRSSRASGRAHPADDLANANGLTFADVERRQVSVPRRQPVAMIDLDHLAVAAAPAGRSDLAGRGRADRVAHIAAHVEPGMHGERAHERIHSDAEAGRCIDLAGEWLADRHGRQGAFQVLDLAARDIDAIELPFERATV